MNDLLFGFTVSLQWRILVLWALLRFLLSMPPRAKAKVNQRDTVISNRLTCCNEILYSDMSGGSKSMPHSEGDKHLHLASQTSVNFLCYLSGLMFSWSTGLKLNSGGFCCCRWCQTEDEMRGYLSLSYVWVCYLYWWEVLPWIVHCLVKTGSPLTLIPPLPISLKQLLHVLFYTVEKKKRLFKWWYCSCRSWMAPGAR